MLGLQQCINVMYKEGIYFIIIWGLQIFFSYLKVYLPIPVVQVHNPSCSGGWGRDIFKFKVSLSNSVSSTIALATEGDYLQIKSEKSARGGTHWQSTYLECIRH